MLQSSRANTRKVLLGLAARTWLYRWHVVSAVVFLVAAKLAAVAVPLTLTRIVLEKGAP